MGFMWIYIMFGFNTINSCKYNGIYIFGRKYKSELVSGMKCELNKKVYKYDIYKEPDGTYSVSMDEKDRIPQSVIDYETPDEIFKSIEKYYIDNGGMCP